MRATIREPKTPFDVNITKQHVKKAIPRDPCNCVVAQALSADPRVLSCEVFAHITTLVTRSGFERYQTPKALRDGLENWDNTGDWKLKPGVYTLLPVTKSQTRKARREGARKRRAAGDPNMFHDRSIYPHRKQNLSPRQITHRELLANSK